METRVYFDRSPDLVHNIRPGVGGEGRATLGGVTLSGTPEADATRLQGLGEGRVAQHLVAHHGLDQAIVTNHQGVQTVRASRLRPLEQSGLGKSAETTHRLVVNVHRAPPRYEMPYFPPSLLRLEAIILGLIFPPRFASNPPNLAKLRKSTNQGVMRLYSVPEGYQQAKSEICMLSNVS
jgi:hypothetical protein